MDTLPPSHKQENEVLRIERQIHDKTSAAGNVSELVSLGT